MLVIVAIIAIKYFLDFDVIKYLMSDNVANVFEYLKKFFSLVWTKYIGGTFWYIWNTVIVGFIWKGIVVIFHLLTGWVDKN